MIRETYSQKHGGHIMYSDIYHELKQEKSATRSRHHWLQKNILLYLHEKMIANIMIITVGRCLGKAVVIAACGMLI